jgi:outer membrane immunogenic protein
VFGAPPAYPAVRGDAQPTVSPGPFSPPPAYPIVKVYDWTGFYVGINGGGGFGSTRWNSTPDLAIGNAKVSGGLAGGTAGYNLQAGGPFVLGIETDLDWSGIKGTATPASCAPGCNLQIPWLGTARLRFGYAFNTIMPYVTGGVAAADLKTAIQGSGFGTEQVTNLSWTAGAGIEFVIAGGLRAKIENLHVDLSGFTCTVACAGGPISFDARNNNVVRAGLNYRLWD